jgi:hypothetical protein
MSLTSALLLLAAASALGDVTLPAVPQDPLDKTRCIREQVTGSLVSTRKVCHTEREWRRIRGDAESEARRIVQPGTPNALNGS